MKLLHTSDWHLGKALYGRRCLHEFSAFLDWLVGEIERQRADCLLVAGDIFDTASPSNGVQRLYYSFLHRVAGGCCRHVVIIGGNHDSPSLLNAPRELLSHLNVTVVGSATAAAEEEVITLRDRAGAAEAIVCAVPYLRDRDVRSAEAGETVEEKAAKLIAGIAGHYEEVVRIACERRRRLGDDLPIIATGHLFAAGGTVKGEGEMRDIAIGSLSHFPGSLFPAEIDYLALGHLHTAQTVDGHPTRRYCGAPLQLSFGRGASAPTISAIQLGAKALIETIPVPPFLDLRTIRGDREEVTAGLEELIDSATSCLLEVQYEGRGTVSLYEDLRALAEGSGVELIRVVDRRLAEQSLAADVSGENLEDLNVFEVFSRCLDEHRIVGEERSDLEFLFSAIIEDIYRGEGGETS